MKDDMAHKLNTFHLFAGAGGGILADLLLGHNPIGACEIEPYPRSVLLARQRDGILPEFPIWDDICTLDGSPWRGLVDIVCGGFPCQDISAAGKGAGIDGERSGLWGEMARIIREIRPRYAFVENSPMLTARGMGRVLGDLAEMGYDAKWCVLGARDVGAPHPRDRIWILAELSDSLRAERKPRAGRRRVRKGYSELADTDKQRTQISTARGFATEQMLRGPGGWWQVDPAELCDSSGAGLQERPAGTIREPKKDSESKRPTGDGKDGPVEPLVGRVAHGLADRVHRLKAIGNGQVPQCAAMAFNILSAGLKQ